MPISALLQESEQIIEKITIAFNVSIVNENFSIE